jgi:hypothetical protein
MADAKRDHINTGTFPIPTTWATWSWWLLTKQATFGGPRIYITTVEHYKMVSKPLAKSDRATIKGAKWVIRIFFEGASTPKDKSFKTDRDLIAYVVWLKFTYPEFTWP